MTARRRRPPEDEPERVVDAEVVPDAGEAAPEGGEVGPDAGAVVPDAGDVLLDEGVLGTDLDIDSVPAESERNFTPNSTAPASPLSTRTGVVVSDQILSTGIFSGLVAQSKPSTILFVPISNESCPPSCLGRMISFNPP